MNTPSGRDSARAHFHAPQGLRGVACLLVAAVHVYGIGDGFGLPVQALSWTRWIGFAGVDLFFVVSGFIIVAANRHAFGRARAVPGYLFRRLWRVYPAYWAAFALSVVITGAVFGRAALAPWTGGQWTAWLSLVPITTPNMMVGQAWTLSYELMFYLVVGVVMLAPPRWAAVALCGWAAAVVGCVVGRVNPPVLALSPLVLEFLCGCAAAWLVGRGVKGFAGLAVVLGLMYAAVGMTLTTTFGPGEWFNPMVSLNHLAAESQQARALVWGPAAGLIVYGLAAGEGRWRPPAWLLRVGDASYSLYLTHAVVIVLGVVVGRSLSLGGATGIIWAVGTFAAVVAVGVLFHRWVERPLLALGRRSKEVQTPRDARPWAFQRLWVWRQNLNSRVAK
jgi:exopolysaccharide production protein ExoZ